MRTGAVCPPGLRSRQRPFADSPLGAVTEAIHRCGALMPKDRRVILQTKVRLNRNTGLQPPRSWPLRKSRPGPTHYGYSLGTVHQSKGDDMNTWRNDRALAYRKLFWRSEPLGRFFLERLKLQPWAATTLLLAVLVVPIYLLITVNGFWSDNNGYIGVLQDYAWWWYQLVSVPLVLFLGFWLQDLILSAAVGLRANGVLVPADPRVSDEDAFRQFITDAAKDYARPIWTVCSLALSILFNIFGSVPLYQQYRVWRGADGFLFWYTQFYWFVAYYYVFLVTFRGVLIVKWLHRLFRRFEARPKALHPDRVGGFAPLGRFALLMGYVIGVFGLTIVVIVLDVQYNTTATTTDLMTQPMLITVMLLVLFIAPAAFVGLLGSTHSAMKRSRDGLLLEICAQFEAVMADASDSVDDDATIRKARIEKLEDLRKMHGIVSQLPVWPLRGTGIVRFFTVVSSPALLALLQVGAAFLIGSG